MEEQDVLQHCLHRRWEAYGAFLEELVFVWAVTVAVEGLGEVEEVAQLVVEVVELLLQRCRMS